MVTAVEPASENFSALEKVSNKYPYVHTEQAAVMDYNGEADLLLKDNPQGHSLLNGPTGKSETVPVRTLSDICSSYEIDHIDFLKVDIEGAEISVLKDSEDVLENTEKVLIEANHTHQLDTYDENRDRVEEILDGYGFATKTTPEHWVYAASDSRAFE